MQGNGYRAPTKEIPFYCTSNWEMKLLHLVSIKQCHRNKIMVMGLLSQDQCCLFWNVFCFTLWPQHLCGSKKPLSVLFQWQFTLSPHLFRCPFFDGSTISCFSYSGSYVRCHFWPLERFRSERLFLPFLKTSSEAKFCCCNYMIAFSLCSWRLHEIILAQYHLWMRWKSFLGTKPLKFPKASYET